MAHRGMLVSAVAQVAVVLGLIHHAWPGSLGGGPGGADSQITTVWPIQHTYIVTYIASGS